MATYMPYVKLEPGKYLIGTRERKLMMKGKSVLVRTGGGYMHFEEYIKHYARSECIGLSKLIRNCDGSVENAMIKLLNKHYTDKKSIAIYKKNCNPEINEQFEQIMKTVKHLDQVSKNSK